MARGFVYKGRTALDISIHLLELAIDDETYLAVLGRLAEGIGIAKSRIAEIDDLEFEQFGAPLVDLETELVENLLGAAYVVCQAKITAVAQAAVNVRKAALGENLTINAYGDYRGTVHRLGPNFDQTYAKVEIIWSLGNYFKHRDEWPIGTWQSPPTSQIKKTIDAIAAAGLQESSTGNLRTGAAALGNSSFEDMAVFGGIISKWAADVRERIRIDIGR